MVLSQENSIQVNQKLAVGLPRLFQYLVLILELHDEFIPRLKEQVSVPFVGKRANIEDTHHVFSFHFERTLLRSSEGEQFQQRNDVFKFFHCFPGLLIYLKK